MELQQYKTRVKELEEENGQKDKIINRLKTDRMELQWKYEKLYENFERFMGNETVGNYYRKEIND